METDNLKKTSLHPCHLAAGAEMVPFAGWEMPLSYTSIEAEHEAVRTACGMFDVSHMGDIKIFGPDAARFVNHVFSNDISNMVDGDILYGMFINEEGGVVDDAVVSKLDPENYYFTVNAANEEKDANWLCSHIGPFNVRILNTSSVCSQIALQGPRSEEVMRDVLGLDCSALGFYRFHIFPYDGYELLVSRTGYTGEDGFEIYTLNDDMPPVWNRLLASGKVTPCGLGCRDTLRFEAGLPLYGNELSDTISPLEAGLGIFVKLDKEEFVGKEALVAQKAEGPRRKLVGLELLAPGIARHGYEVTDSAGNTVGTVTTGYYSPTLGKPLAMALVDSAFAALGTELKVRVRRREIPARVVKKRFYTPRYRR